MTVFFFYYFLFRLVILFLNNFFKQYQLVMLKSSDYSLSVKRFFIFYRTLLCYKNSPKSIAKSKVVNANFFNSESKSLGLLCLIT